MTAALGGGASGAADGTTEIAGITLVAREVAGLDKNGLRALVDKQRDRIKSGVVVWLRRPTTRSRSSWA